MNVFHRLAADGYKKLRDFKSPKLPRGAGPLKGWKLGLRQAPAAAWFATEKLVGVWVVRDAHGLGIPQDLATCAIGDITKVVGFRQRTSIAEGTGGGGTGLTGQDPFGLMPR